MVPQLKENWGSAYRSMPKEVHVGCRKYSNRAIFSPAFSCISAKDHDAIAIQSPKAWRIQWGGFYIEENFPVEFSWRDSDNPFTNHHLLRQKKVAGVLTCLPVLHGESIS